MKLFRRFKGMIRPNMAATFDEAKRVMDRKGFWMVEYLRSRRSDGYKAMARRKYLKERDNLLGQGPLVE